MNKKIKVIELINKIYENLDVPKKVKYHDIVFEYKESFQEYVATKGNVTSFLINNIICLRDNWLDVEVEILEDEVEIDTIRDYRTSDDDLYNDNFDDFKNKINEIIKKVNELNKKINKED